MVTNRVVALLGVGVVPADTPILRADDLGALRGDGIFETMHVRAGQPWLMDEHLARLARSAARLDLPLPDRSALVELIFTALASWVRGEGGGAADPAGTTGAAGAEGAAAEGALRLVCTRGAEDSPDPATTFITIAPVSEASRRARHDGVSVLTASLGLTAAGRAGSPWLLGGAKTLSYAVNIASQRWAQASGADDVLWMSSDGYALEAPTSSLVWLDGQTLCTVPPEGTGILPGVSAAWLLGHASTLGWVAEERMITPAELTEVDGAWLTSSIRGVAPIRTLDRTPLRTTSDTTTSIRNLLGYA